MGGGMFLFENPSLLSSFNKYHNIVFKIIGRFIGIRFSFFVVVVVKYRNWHGPKKKPATFQAVLFTPTKWFS